MYGKVVSSKTLLEVTS